MNPYSFMLYAVLNLKLGSLGSLCFFEGTRVGWDQEHPRGVKRKVNCKERIIFKGGTN